MTTSVDWRTPNLTVIDSRGLPIRQVAYLRKVAAGPVEPMIGRQRYDVAGRLLEQWDPRLFGIVPNMSSVYGLSGEPLKVESVDAGWRLSLPGLAGEELQRWDQRGNHWRTTYDRQLRPIAVEENGQPNVETFYADDSADPAFNLRGQLTGQLDRSGTLSFDSYSLLGHPLRETRTLAEDQPYVSSRTFSPLGTVLSQTDAGEHQQQSRYDIAGQLKQVELRIKDSPNWQPVLQDAQYNAAGQIIEQRAGNEVLSTWTYDPADGRLATQRAQKKAEQALQDLEYFYDRVGNITRLEDHTFQPIHFANQLVDGHRDFTYDSLYRLTRASGYDDAPPSDVPGRPLPGDPNNRLNYTQHYEYDAGNNLIELRHVRAGASHTRGMFIDPASNRGVRWKEGDPVPVFPALFDVHGNLQHLQPGKTLTWNTLDQLASVTLVKRDNGTNDQEFYRYSQGVRVFKRHETHTPSLTHFQEVIYLPGLEIRTRDNGEELHVITLPGGHGSVRCLHWVSGQPANIAADQVRYSVDDHLGSSTLELDQNAQVISEEGYYPFGATAWFARGSEVDVDYKTIRYSGKEMDDSGLYYYGARYYAPWLQRWVSADPAGDVDGLNLYGFVGNNPMLYVDVNGETRSNSFSEATRRFQARENIEYASMRQASAPVRARQALQKNIETHLKVLGLSKRRGLDAQQQILNHRSPSEHAVSTTRRTGVHLGGQILSYGAGIAIGAALQPLASVAPGVGNVAAVALGFAVKKGVSFAVDYIAERTGASASVNLKGSKLSPEKIINKAEYKTMAFTPYIEKKYEQMIKSNTKGRLKAGKEGASVGASVALKIFAPQVASEASAGLGMVLGGVEIIHEVNGAGNELSAEKTAKADTNLTDLIDALDTRMAGIEAFFNSMDVSAMNTFSLFGESAGDSVQSLWQETRDVIGVLKDTQTMLRSRSSKFTAV